jgi:iron(III) transport system permease protein
VLSIACILVYPKPLPGLGLSLYNTFWILLVAYLGRFLALAFRPTLAGFMALEPALEDAARVVGAGTWRRLTRILVPLVLPAAAAGALLVFMSAFNELTVSALLWSTGNETLGVIVFRLYDEGNSPAAAAVATLSVLVVLALAALASLAARLGGLPRGALPWQA